MTRKHRRLVLLLACGVGLGTATALVLAAFRDNLVFFLSPAEVAKAAPPPGRDFRLGGLVEQGSVHKATVDGHPAAAFTVTDGGATVKVTYVGILPDLFREGQGVVALARCCRTARSAPPRCWPSTTRPTCRRRSRTR